MSEKDRRKRTRQKMLKRHKLKPQTRIKFHIVYLLCFCCLLLVVLGEVIYTTATTKPSAMPTNSLLRSSLSVNSRHHQRTTSGMTSSSSATSSNSNNINNERHRDNNSRSGELQKPSGTTATAAFNGESREDDSPNDGHLNRLHHQNGKILHIIFSCCEKGLVYTFARAHKECANVWPTR